MSAPLRLAVLNPGGNDRHQTFPDLAGPVDDRFHAPINYHGYAACTGGSFHRTTSTIPETQTDVLLLVRWDLPRCLKALRQLKEAGKTVGVSLKESGGIQFAELFLAPEKIDLLHEICALADGCLATTPFLESVYRTAGARIAAFIPTPYPLSEARWDFSVPLEQRAGIFIGTREFEIPSRNHLAALMLARRWNERITVINVEGRPGRKRLAALHYDKLSVVEGPLAYSEYLRLLAGHRVVFQLDRSAVPGQVAGDALLARTPCVGGDGAIDQIAFPGFSALEGDAASTLVRQLLADDALWRLSVTDALAVASASISFESSSRSLAAFFAECRSGKA